MKNFAKFNFFQRCLTFMDRGFVFKLINLYVDKFAYGGSRTLHDMKFDFLQIVCSHEHFISFNLPLMQSWSATKGIITLYLSNIQILY